MKITKEEFERFVIKTGPELGMKMGDFWYEFFTSSSDENNYTIHFNCNTPNILNEVKSKIEDNFKCTFFNDCRFFRIADRFVEKFKYQYYIHFKMHNGFPKLVKMSDDLIKNLNESSKEHTEEFSGCVGSVVGHPDLGSGPELDTLDIKWQPSGLKYMYPIDGLEVILR